MRKSRVRAILEQELNSPMGMSKGSFRAAKKRYADGNNRGFEPKTAKRKGTPGFPKGTIRVIKTWTEKQPRIESTIVQKVKGKDGILQKRRMYFNRTKAVTRVLTTSK